MRLDRRKGRPDIQRCLRVEEKYCIRPLNLIKLMPPDGRSNP